MKERISCFDVDGTLANGLLFVPLIKSEYEAGHLDGGAFTQISELLVAYKSGNLAYEDAVEKLLCVHAKGLRGEKHQDLKRHAERFLEVHEKELFHKFGREVIQILGMDHRLFIVTAEPHYLAEAVSDMYDISGYISSIYTESNGIFTGEVERSLAHRTAKALLMKEYTIEFAFGDSEGDIDMLNSAKYPYCINPTSGLKVVANDNDWPIFGGDDTEGIVNSVKSRI